MICRPVCAALVALFIASLPVASARADHAHGSTPATFAVAPARQPAADAVLVESNVQGVGKSEAGRAAISSSSSADVRVVVPLGRSHAMVSRLWGSTVRDGDASITLGMAASGLRYHLGGAFWAELGLGVAHTSVDRDDAIDVVGLTSLTPAVVAAASAELGVWAGVALDVELRTGTSLYQDALPAHDSVGLLRARW